MHANSFRRLSQAALEVYLREALDEVKDRPDMRPFLRTILGDTLHEMKLEEIARGPNADVILPFMFSEKAPVSSPSPAGA